MHKIHSLMKVVVIASILLLLMTACTSEPAPETPLPETASAAQAEATPVPETASAAQGEATPVPETEGTTQEEDTSEAPAATEELIITLTPAPTATPGPLNKAVAEIAQATGADRT